MTFVGFTASIPSEVVVNDPVVQLKVTPAGAVKAFEELLGTPVNGTFIMKLP